MRDRKVVHSVDKMEADAIRVDLRRGDDAGQRRITVWNGPDLADEEREGEAKP